MTSNRRTLALLALLPLAAACGGDGGAAASTTLAPATTAAAPGVTAAVDWTARTITVDGHDGPPVAFCEGAAPLLCVGEPGELLGVIALVTVAGGAADRREGCDPDVELEAHETADADVAGHDGFRYGLTASIGDRVVERVVGHGAVVGDDLHLLVLNALADDGCLARESELPLDVARQLEPVVAAIAAGSSGLPAPATT